MNIKMTPKVSLYTVVVETPSTAVDPLERLNLVNIDKKTADLFPPQEIINHICVPIILGGNQT